MILLNFRLFNYLSIINENSKFNPKKRIRTVSNNSFKIIINKFYFRNFIKNILNQIYASNLSLKKDLNGKKVNKIKK